MEMENYIGPDMNDVAEPDLVDDARKIILITQDESAFYANDGNTLILMKNNKRKLRPKTNGSSLMVSTFV